MFGMFSVSPFTKRWRYVAEVEIRTVIRPRHLDSLEAIYCENIAPSEPSPDETSDIGYCVFGVVLPVLAGTRKRGLEAVSSDVGPENKCERPNTG